MFKSKKSNSKIIKIINTAILSVGIIGFVIFFNSRSQNILKHEVVVSIKPLHSIVCKLLKNISVPYLIFNGAKSVHEAQFQPSQFRYLDSSKLIIWIGVNVETKLSNILNKKQYNTLQVDTLPLDFKCVRSISIDGNNTCNHIDHCNHHKDALDGHIWLDPQAIIKLIPFIVKELKKIYPNHLKELDLNQKNTIDELNALTLEIKNILTKVKHKAYLTTHDSMQYFDNRFGTKAILSIFLNHQTNLSFKMINALKNNNHIKLYYFAFDNKKTINFFADSLKIKTKQIDDEGIFLPSGINTYNKILLNLANSFVTD